ncbi:WD40 repeat domain-containing protein [Dehalococcoidales bacterium]|nr:WD40 repeat domain-containing protein [Dehalococcoidales bacterium]
MKSKKSKILGVGLAAMLAFSLVAVALPVSPAKADPGTLKWSKETLPTVGPEGVDVVDFAVGHDGTTIYAVTGDTVNPKDRNIFKSTNAGVTWSQLTVTGVTKEITSVAVAPDDVNVVAVVADDNEVFVSTDGGATWNPLPPLDAEVRIYDIDISPVVGGVRNIAAAGHNTNVAFLQYFNLGVLLPKWTDAWGWDGKTDADLVGAVKFSPNFVADRTMVAVTAKSGEGVHFQIASFAGEAWNEAAGFTGYAVKIKDLAADKKVKSLSISLAPDYLAADPAARIAFVGVADNTNAKGGIFRLIDIAKKALKEDVKIHSVAFDGENLVAGRFDDNVVHRSADPLATAPTVLPTPVYKGPGGEDRTVVAWAGANVVAGTSGANSAFAVSRNNGKTFNDISLIDTKLTTGNDVAISPDGTKVYMTTDDDTYLSLWRKTSSWERVLSIEDTGYIVRIAPDNPDVVYVAEKGGRNIYYSPDGGETKWHLRYCIVDVQDLAVEGAGDVAYALEATGKVSKTTNAGFIWGTPVATGLTDGATIINLGVDNLIVGGGPTESSVAYSTDGGATWTEIGPLEVDGNVQVIASGLADGDFIYAASSGVGTHVERWQIGVSTDWESIHDGVAGYGVYGIGLHDGVLYVIATDATNDTIKSKLFRTLDPTADNVAWSTVTEADEAFNVAPQALRITAGPKLWAIDTQPTPDELWSYTDTLTEVGPTLLAPAPGAETPIHPVTGRAFDVTFSWERLSEATAYDLKIALDEGFTQVIRYEESLDSTAEEVIVILGPHTKGPVTEATLEYMPGTTYYWKVRVASDGPIYSPWSETRSFTVAAIEPPPPPVVVEEVPPPVIEVPPPVIEYITPAYIWAIIVIGAILVIAVLVLIVRTRRPA